MKKRLLFILCGLIGLSLGCEKLVYVRESGGAKRIYVMRNDGSSAHLISPDTGTTYSHPDVSSDGKKIAYTDGQKVFISDLYDIGGSSEKELSTPLGRKIWLRWATQHEVVAYANFNSSNKASIFLSATSGDSSLQVTFPSGSQSDGGGHDFYLNNNVQYLVYSRDGDLYTMFYNGTQPPTRITNTENIKETRPVVSHDGRLMAYRVFMQLLDRTLESIQIVDVGTWTARYRFTLQPPVATGTISAIAFSCDDKRLYVAAETTSGEKEILSVKLDGTDQQLLTDNTIWESYPNAIPKPCP